MRRTLAIILVVTLCLLFLASIQLQLTHSAVNSCVGYWKFDEGSGTVAHYSSGNGNDGAIMAITIVLKLIGVF